MLPPLIHTSPLPPGAEEFSFHLGTEAKKIACLHSLSPRLRSLQLIVCGRLKQQDVTNGLAMLSQFSHLSDLDLTFRSVAAAAEMNE